MGDIIIHLCTNASCCTSCSPHLGLLAAEEGVALQPLGLMVTSNVAEHFVIVRIHGAVGHPWKEGEG